MTLHLRRQGWEDVNGSMVSWLMQASSCPGRELWQQDLPSPTIKTGVCDQFRWGIKEPGAEILPSRSAVLGISLTM